MTTPSDHRETKTILANRRQFVGGCAAVVTTNPVALLEKTFSGASGAVVAAAAQELFPIEFIRIAENRLYTVLTDPLDLHQCTVTVATQLIFGVPRASSGSSSDASNLPTIGRRKAAEIICPRINYFLKVRGTDAVKTFVANIVDEFNRKDTLTVALLKGQLSAVQDALESQGISRNEIIHVVRRSSKQYIPQSDPRYYTEPVTWDTSPEGARKIYLRLRLDSFSKDFFKKHKDEISHLYAKGARAAVGKVIQEILPRILKGELRTPSHWEVTEENTLIKDKIASDITVSEEAINKPKSSRSYHQLLQLRKKWEAQFNGMSSDPIELDEIQFQIECYGRILDQRLHDASQENPLSFGTERYLKKFLYPLFGDHWRKLIELTLAKLGNTTG